MSNETVANDAYRRPHSPPSLDDAELLRFVSKRSSDSPLVPLMAQASKISPPESFSSSVAAQSAAETSASLKSSGEAEMASAPQGPFSADKEDDSDAGGSLPPVNCTADGKLHIKDSFTSPNQRHRVNRPVDHTYTDYAVISDDELRRLDQDSSVLSSPALSLEKKRLLGKLKEMPCRSAGGVTQSFPSKLHQVLANNELAEVISWMPHGRCFVIHQSEVLATEVLPRFFNQTKFLSFIRQLNLWGFKRLTRGVDGKAYYHELFLRGRPYLALRLKRMKIKGHGFKPIPNPAGEPNFYNGFSPVGGVTTTGLTSAEGNSSSPKAKEVGVVCTKKQIVMRRSGSITNGQTKMIGFLNGSLSWDAPTIEQSHICHAGNDNILLTPALTRTAPATASFSAGLQTTAPDVKDTNAFEVFTNSEASVATTNADDRISMEILALLRSRQLALHAASAPTSQLSSELESVAGHKSTVETSPLADQLAAFIRIRNRGNCLVRGAGAHAGLALLAGLQTTENAQQVNISGIAAQMTTLEGRKHSDVSQIRHKSASYAGGELQHSRIPGSYSSTTGQPNIEDCLLADRFSQLQREREEIALMRNARLYEDFAVTNNVNRGLITFSDLEALTHSTDLNLNSNHGQGQTHTYLANGVIPFIPTRSHTQNVTPVTSLSSIRDPIAVSVTEALREANHLEELALASRARARNLALVGALEVQSRYDALLKNPLNGGE